MTFPSINNSPVFQAELKPELGLSVAALTLEGIRVAGDEVLKLVAVGVNVVKSFSFYSKLVALLHFPGAARWTIVLTNQKIHIWKNQAEKKHVFVYNVKSEVKQSISKENEVQKD